MQARAEGVETRQLLAGEGIAGLVSHRQMRPEPCVAQLRRLDHLLHDPARLVEFGTHPVHAAVELDLDLHPARGPGRRCADRVHACPGVDGRDQVPRDDLPHGLCGGLGEEQDRHLQARFAQDHALFDERDGQ